MNIVMNIVSIALHYYDFVFKLTLDSSQLMTTLMCNQLSPGLPK